MKNQLCITNSVLYKYLVGSKIVTIIARNVNNIFINSICFDKTVENQLFIQYLVCFC